MKFLGMLLVLFTPVSVCADESFKIRDLEKAPEEVRDVLVKSIGERCQPAVSFAFDVSSVRHERGGMKVVVGVDYQAVHNDFITANFIQEASSSWRLDSLENGNLICQ